MLRHCGGSFRGALTRVLSSAPAGGSGEFVRAEPPSPVLCGAIPGPKSRELARRLSEATLGKASAFNVLFDPDASAGNFFADPDGAKLLDVFCHIASMPVGYGNRLFQEKISQYDLVSMLATRPALGVHPSSGYPDLVERFNELAKPRGLDRVAFMLCGSSSNENAIKLCFMKKMSEERGGRVASEMTVEEMNSAMASRAPGCPKLSIMSFGRSFHGRSLALLSLTHSKAIHKLDIPAFPWPWAPMPETRYPADEAGNRAWNEDEERRCLAEIEEMIDAAEGTAPVAGMIIEPIQAEGGDVQASHRFYRGLREIASRRGVGFIVDEVQTGVHATGSMWAHDAWKLEEHGLEPPDIVTFAKKMQAAGMFIRESFVPDGPYRIYNTWMGDPLRLVTGIAVLETAEELGYPQRVRDAGAVLRAGLQAIADAHGGEVISAIRGRGTFLAFDLPDGPTRDAFNAECLRHGLLTGPCGDRTVRLRPMLCFTPRHAEMALGLFGQAADAVAAAKAMA